MSEPENEPLELVVLGGGPGGYPAAFGAADRGMDVTLVNEDEHPGGVCLNRGCIPSKTLLHVAKLIGEARQAADCGVTFGDPKIDLQRLREFKDGVTGKLTGGIEQLCQARGVKLVRARGRLADSNTLTLTRPDGQVEPMQFERLILATGSVPVMPEMFALDDPRIMDSSAALELPDIPNRLLVIGGGYIGLEMGSVYAALGAQVTVVEMTSGLLPGVDRDLVGPLKKRLDRFFTAINVNTRVTSLAAEAERIAARLDGENVDPVQTFDRVLVAVGRKPNSDSLGLENTRVAVDERGFVKVDKQQRTDDPNILAVGDITGEPMLAHKATHEAKVAVDVLAGEPTTFDNRAIPAVVFTDPELAWCGLTETESKTAGLKVKTFRFPWLASGRAQTLGRPDGLTKIIVDADSQQVLGVGIVGPSAGELIAEGVLAVETAVTAATLAHAIHAHPTLSETLMEAADGILGRATHVYRPPRR